MNLSARDVATNMLMRTTAMTSSEAAKLIDLLVQVVREELDANRVPRGAGSGGEGA